MSIMEIHAIQPKKNDEELLEIGALFKFLYFFYLKSTQSRCMSSSTQLDTSSMFVYLNLLRSLKLHIFHFSFSYTQSKGRTVFSTSQCLYGHILNKYPRVPLHNHTWACHASCTLICLLTPIHEYVRLLTRCPPLESHIRSCIIDHTTMCASLLL